MEPRKLKKWLMVIAVVYLVFPRDLIPDFLGRGLGLLDDLLLIGILTYLYRRHLRRLAGEARENGTRDREEERLLDPHEVLGIAPSASRKTIQSAYKARMSEYHPDKVAHLGEDLQKLAHRKALEIQRAYQQLSK